MGKLYIIEGLPCSGKSTAAKFIAEKVHGICIDEGSGKHPADYEFHAFIPKQAFNGFTEDELLHISEHSEIRPDGYILPLSAVSGELFDKALKYKIYDFLPWETEYPIMLEKWRSFAENADSIYVLNCVLLQNPMCETMIRFNFDISVSAEYIAKICEVVKDMSPTVIYLRNNDIAESIRAALPERGDDWLNSVIHYHCDGEYGKANSLSGFDGYISALCERQQRELEILSSLPVRSAVINDPQNDFTAAYSEIEKFL